MTSSFAQTGFDAAVFVDSSVDVCQICKHDRTSHQFANMYNPPMVQWYAYCWICMSVCEQSETG